MALLLLAPVTGADAPRPMPAEKPVPSEKKICRAEEATGSLLPRRVCHTKADWAQIDSANEDATNKLRDRQHGN